MKSAAFDSEGNLMFDCGGETPKKWNFWGNLAYPGLHHGKHGNSRFFRLIRRGSCQNNRKSKNLRFTQGHRNRPHVPVTVRTGAQLRSENPQKATFANRPVLLDNSIPAFLRSRRLLANRLFPPSLAKVRPRPALGQISLLEMSSCSDECYVTARPGQCV